jgi:hypothetical protein
VLQTLILFLARLRLCAQAWPLLAARPGARASRVEPTMSLIDTWLVGPFAHEFMRNAG